jgi:hypothetical protein
MFPATAPLTRRAFLAATAAVGATVLHDRVGAQTPEPDATANDLLPRPVQEITVLPVRDPAAYVAYCPTPCKAGQWQHYTCEFDAAWAVFKAWGIDAGFEEQLAACGHDTTLEPWYEQTGDGSLFVYGGDIAERFCGDYATNFLARCTGAAMVKVFDAFGLPVRRIDSREELERSLRRGRQVWIKTTVDFRDWKPATWVTDDGAQYPGVLGNDHAVVVIGYDDEVVVIRDVLGPTVTNEERQYEYEVRWDRFLQCWGAQANDGLAVSE